MIIDTILSLGCIIGLLGLISYHLYHHHTNNHHLATLLLFPPPPPLPHFSHHCRILIFTITLSVTAGFLSTISHYYHCDLHFNHQAAATITPTTVTTSTIASNSLLLLMPLSYSIITAASASTITSPINNV